MEERIGKFWHKIASHIAQGSYQKKAVYLKDIHHKLQIIFCALGGQRGLFLKIAPLHRHFSKRSFWQRISGEYEKISLAYKDDEAFYLPQQISTFNCKRLNYKLYIWLCATCAVARDNNDTWIKSNQDTTKKVLKKFVGLNATYKELCQAYINERSGLNYINKDEIEQEAAIIKALLVPGSVKNLPIAQTAPAPVILWHHPNPPEDYKESKNKNNQQPKGKTNTKHQKTKKQNNKKYQAKREKFKENKAGIILTRFENIFSHSEYSNNTLKNNEENADNNLNNPDDLDSLSVAEDRGKSGSVKFDLDLPSQAADDAIIKTGELLPEYDYKTKQMQEDYCVVTELCAIKAPPISLPQDLKTLSKKLKAQFQLLAPKREIYKNQTTGDDIDIDSFVDFYSKRRAVKHEQEPKLYTKTLPARRELSCLLLADLSLSTDSSISPTKRVIDVVKNSLYLFAESLTAIEDNFAIYGFSSKNRMMVRFHTIKTFKEKYNDKIRGRINKIKPGFYTRMGAAIRKSTKLLKKTPTEQKLLLILTDGKPNDLDRYDSRYGVEDTRVAIIEAKKEGFIVFCVTIDEAASDYLPYIFGSSNYTLIRSVSHLPLALPMLYAKLKNKQFV
jgi:nitric oxide reductase NorD protein